MYGLLEDRCLDDVVARAEQARLSYSLQHEEFRYLNANLQVYLTDMKRIEDENRQLEGMIEQIRNDYILTLEQHLKRLPNDFRQESQTLNNAHLERYRSKSRARRHLNEREETKKRIQFLVSQEKEASKRCNQLQKQERSMNNEMAKLNEQMQHLLRHVENEKQTHRQAMEKVDQLQLQLEQACVQRSKTEFEIQTLREEVKLMQTAKEFLDEEQQTILATQTDANEYLLSRLNQAISRIRDDFDQLNKTQLKQIENQYQQLMQTAEENLSNKSQPDQSAVSQQHVRQIEYEQESIAEELTVLNDYHQSLADQILSMEGDLHEIRNERIRDLMIKDNEFERNQIELQSLYEKLNHLAEYDRNLKFELTLYRGVLENEHRRKQPMHSIRHTSRPTTLRTSTTRKHRSSTEEFLGNDESRSSTNDSVIDPTEERLLATVPSKTEKSDDENSLSRTASELFRTEAAISVGLTDLIKTSPPADRQTPEIALELTDTIEDDGPMISTPFVQSNDVGEEVKDPPDVVPEMPNASNALTTSISPDSRQLTTLTDRTDGESQLTPSDVDNATDQSLITTDDETPFSSNTTIDSVVPQVHVNSTDEIPGEEEEIVHSSPPIPIEEIKSLAKISSPSEEEEKTFNDITRFIERNASRLSSMDVPVDNTDVPPEADSSASSKADEKPPDEDMTEVALEAVMQDLRCVYRDLANRGELIEIDDDFSENLIERLEFGDHLIRTLFDNLLRKYIIQAAKELTRPKTLDWTEFRDVLFPIITGRYMEQHLRQLFELFDTQKTGHLASSDITALLELLQVPNASDRALKMVDGSNGKLSADEFLEAVQRTEEMMDNFLPEDTKYKPWYNRRPVDDDDTENQSLIFEVPTINFPSKSPTVLTEDTVKSIHRGISLLGRMFKRVGIDVDSKQLDSHKAALAMKLTNEFINNNIHISSDDLQRFIQHFLTKKQRSDPMIDWFEFRDVFLPFVNGGMFSREDLVRWFEILDVDHNAILGQDQILHLLRLLQFPYPNDLLKQMNEISQSYTNNNDSWTLDELIFALENLDEIKFRLLANAEQLQQTNAFNLEWLKKNTI